MSDPFHDRSKQNYYFWDLVRFVAAIAVVDIHTGAYFISVARFAVPFFFITSGFFISRGIDGASRKQYLLKHVKRLLIYYFAWWIIYWPKELFSIFESLENAHQNFFAALN